MWTIVRRRKASWARLIQKVYEVDPLECTHCGATMRIVALIDDAGVIERILKHLSVWDPQPETPSAPQGTRSFRLHTRIQRPLSIPAAAPTR